MVDVFGDDELLGENQGDPDLVGAQERVWADDGSACIVDALAHHFHAKETLFSLQELFDSWGLSVGFVLSPLGIKETYDRVLELEPFLKDALELNYFFEFILLGELKC